MTVTEPGYYLMTMADYLADPCPEPSLNHSLAHILLSQSPWHAKLAHPKLNPDLVRENNGDFDLGTAVHQLVLEDEVAFLEVPAKDWKTKVAKQDRRDAWKNGLIPLLTHQMQTVRAMAAAIRAQVRAYTPVPFERGWPERVLIWKEGPTWCRARLDWLHLDHRMIDDLKTTGESAHPAEWARRLFERGHDLQFAFHTRGVQQVFKLVPDFRFIVAENFPPYAVSQIGLDPEAEEFARDRMRHAVGLWAECLIADKWPGYMTRRAYAEVPPWVKARWVERGYYEASR